MAMTVGWGEILLRLALAAIVGLILGFNRTERGHPAGLRTMLLVSVAAAMAMIEANLLLGNTQGAWSELFRLDVMRLPLGILSGIGFIGAGTILRRGDFVRGLTTAATIWFVTVIGICFGGGQIGLGLAGAVIGVATLSMLGWVEGFMHPDRRGIVSVVASAEGPTDEDLRALLRREGLSLRGWEVSLRQQEAQHSLRYHVKFGAQRGHDPAHRLLRDLGGMPGVLRAEFRCMEN
jgi:putative Mg2+ transporter-C (MgtC) family protein